MGFSRTIHTLKDVVDWGLCTGCGACLSACPKGGITLINIPNVGIRPQLNLPECASCKDCLTVCPGYLIAAPSGNGNAEESRDTSTEFGTTLEIYEGYAADPVIRHMGSSGGILTALALYCLEAEGMGFVLHSGMDRQHPWLNKTRQSRTRADLLACTGSRYAPSSPCEGLDQVENSDCPCVFIGKPCDAAAVSMLCKQRPELERKVGIILTFFCAGTPSTNSTLNLLASMNIDPASVDNIRYRGEGWPGGFKVRLKSDANEPFIPYTEAWKLLEKKRPFRCHLCPDGLGRLADISCGDAWHRYQNNGDQGLSIVLVRTERGRQLLERAARAGFVFLKPSDPSQVLAAQPNLLRRKRFLFGRLLAMRLLLIPIPNFKGFTLFRDWQREALSSQLKSILGTWRRLLNRGLWHRRPRQTNKPLHRHSHDTENVHS